VNPVQLYKIPVQHKTMTTATSGQFIQFFSCAQLSFLCEVYWLLLLTTSVSCLPVSLS